MPRVNAEPFYQGSVKVDDYRVLGESARAALVAAKNPLDELVGANYTENVAKIKKGVIIPPRVSRPAMMYAIYRGLLLERVPVNFARLETLASAPDSARMSLVSYMFRCPHPTAEEVEAWMSKFEALHAECEKLAPGYSFAPFIISGDKPSDSVMMSVIMYRS